MMHSTLSFAVLSSLMLSSTNCLPLATSKPLPVILFHGIFSGPSSMFLLEEFIKEALSGVQVYNIDAFNNLKSTTNMWEQLEGVRDMMVPIFQKHPDGVNMICYSQGGLTCRAVLQTTPDHNVKTFISLSSPQAGQFGQTDFLEWIVPDCATDAVYKIFYTSLSQKTISISNYWRDPYQADLYLTENTYLPALNGLSADNAPSGSTSGYQANFTRLERLVMIGGPQDGVITPWQSSYFAFYDKSDNVVDYKEQEYYIKDTFGLRTLDESGRAIIHVVPGVEHLHWPLKYKVFTNYILPYLKP